MGDREQLLTAIWDVWEKPFPRPDQFARFIAQYQAAKHIAVYHIDGNPEQVFKAWCEFDDLGILPPDLRQRGGPTPRLRRH